MSDAGKPAWPLLLLAGLSFVPGFGFFLGSAAVTWGLLSERRHAKLAVGIGAAGALAHVAVFGLFLLRSNQRSPLFRQAFAEVARQDLVNVVEALEAHHRQQAVYPPTLMALARASGLRRPVNILDHSGGAWLRAPAYQYRLAADGQSYDVFGIGPDGKPDTHDDVRPVLAEDVRARSGYRPGKPPAP